MIPTLLVPGLLSTADIFLPQIPVLWRYGSVTVASMSEGVTIAAIASSILASAPPHFALAGISMGGYVCFEIMRQAPQRVLRLALLDTSARPDTIEQSERRRATVEKANSVDFAAFAEKLFTGSLHPDHRDDDRLRSINQAMAKIARIDDFRRNTEAVIARPDSRSQLRDIAVPTLVMVGDRDELTPPSHAEEICRLIAGAKLRIVPNSGHASTIEQPEVVNALLKEWVSA